MLKPNIQPLGNYTQNSVAFCTLP